MIGPEEAYERWLTKMSVQARVMHNMLTEAEQALVKAYFSSGYVEGMSQATAYVAPIPHNRDEAS